MANKRITDVDTISSLNSDESFFVNQNNTIKQINKSNIVFGFANGGTNATTPEGARANLDVYSKTEMDTKVDTLTGTVDTLTDTVGTLTDTVDTLTDTMGTLTSTVYPADITTVWDGTEAPYSQSIEVIGITADDKPVVDLVTSDTYAVAQTQLENWSNIYKIVTAKDEITVYSTAKTSVVLPIQLKK